MQRQDLYPSELSLITDSLNHFAQLIELNQIDELNDFLNNADHRLSIMNHNALDFDMFIAQLLALNLVDHSRKFTMAYEVQQALFSCDGNLMHKVAREIDEMELSDEDIQFFFNFASETYQKATNINGVDYIHPNKEDRTVNEFEMSIAHIVQALASQNERLRLNAERRMAVLKAFATLAMPEKEELMTPEAFMKMVQESQPAQTSNFDDGDDEELMKAIALSMQSLNLDQEKEAQASPAPTASRSQAGRYPRFGFSTNEGEKEMPQEGYELTRKTL